MGIISPGAEEGTLRQPIRSVRTRRTLPRSPITSGHLILQNTC